MELVIVELEENKNIPPPVGAVFPLMVICINIGFEINIDIPPPLTFEVLLIIIT